MSEALTETALEVARHYPVFPCHANKEPVCKGGFKAATRDPDQVRKLFSSAPAELLGVPTGSASGIVVVDVDPKGAPWLDARRLVLPTTREHKTPRGVHLIFKAPAQAIGCSVGKLAPGVDVRGEGGYVVWWAAAGYEVANPDELAELPQKIIDAVGQRPAPAVDDGDPLSLNRKEKTNTPVKRARRLLANLNPDCGYDEWHKVGMALQHEFAEAGFELWNSWSERGGKYPGRVELEAKWASFGNNSGPPITLRYLLKLAKDQTSALAPAGGDGPFTWVDAGELMTRQPPGWIVRGLIPIADLGQLYAASGIGKTFFALDLALHIATGTPWRGLETKKLRVGYVCAEGAGGFGMRIRAALQASGLSLDGCTFKVLTGAPNFLDDKQVNAMVEQMRSLGGFDFVVVDTVAQVTPGGNENAGEDMGQMIGNCRKLNAAFGAFVLLLHHPGKDESKGARGWSGTRGALDVELEITRLGDVRVARVTKQKDGADGGQYGFRLRQITVEGVVDADGFPVTSCHIEAVGDLAPHQRVKVKEPTSANQRIAWQAFLENVTTGDAIDEESLVAAAAGQLTKPDGRDTRRQVMQRAVNRLIGAGYLKRGDDNLLRRPQ